MVTSKATSTNSTSKSMRIVIPPHVIEKLGIKLGDNIAWDIDKNEGGNWVAWVSKADSQ